MADGGDAGPTLDHQADQRREEEKKGISLAESDRLVREERERIKKKLEKQKQREKSRKKKRSSYDDEDDAELYESGMWIEALRKNKKPYLIAQIVKISNKGKTFDLKYEDGYIERNVKPWDKKKKKSSLFKDVNMPRIRITKTGSRTTNVTKKGSVLGKETYDSKRDAYHGVEVDGHMKKMEEKYQQREALRKEERQKQREKEKEEMEQQKAELQQADEDDIKQGEDRDSDSDSDSDSDYDSDNDGNNDFSSDEEVMQKDKDDKLFTSRLARQGGVGGAQMKVTARNLRIREDTAKYLRNLNPDSAYYDPKSRSMRDNPYANNAEEGNDLAQQQAAEEQLGFAGDNFSRISGDAVKLAETQLFAWDAEKKVGEGAIHVQADPSKAELMRRKVESRGLNIKEKKRKAVLDRYGGQEYLDAGANVSGGAGGDGADSKETPEERATRFGVSHQEQEYGRDGRLASAGSGGAKQKKRAAIPCKYEEDICPNGHTEVWGSYFHKGAFKWGYSDDHSLIKSSYGTGANGRIANDESNELQYGSGMAGSAMLASARKMLEVIPKASNNVSLKDGGNKPGQQSKMYGSSIDQMKEFDKEKVKEAMKRQQQQEEDAAAAIAKSGKRKYNSLSADVDVTEEDMEAYRLRKGRGEEDPMAKLGDDELLDYNK